MSERDDAQKVMRYDAERIVDEVIQERVDKAIYQLIGKRVKEATESLYDYVDSAIADASTKDGNIKGQIRYFGGSSVQRPMNSVDIAFQHLGTGSILRTVQDVERAIVRSGDFASNANFLSCLATLTETIGMAALNISAIGTYTSTQMNDAATSLLNGISTATEFHANFGSTFNATEAFAAGILVPSTAAVFQANAVAGYINASGTSTASVAGFFQARSLANSVKIWGLNPIVQDSSGQTGVAMIGVEVDVNLSNIGTTGGGLTLTGSFTAQPTTFNAILIDKPGSNQWTGGLHVNAGAISGNAAVDVYQQTTGNNVSSQLIMMHGKDSGGTDRLAYINADPNGALVLTPLAGQVVSVSGGITTTAQVAATATRSTSTRDADHASCVFLEFSSGGRILVEGPSSGVLSPFTILLTDNAGASGVTGLTIATSGAVTIPNLAGVGSRTVVADANGVLSAP